MIKKTFVGLGFVGVTLLLTCGTPEQKDSKPSVEPIKIKG